MTEAQARGIAVPEQLAVVGFGDLEFAADLHPALTTVRIDGAAIGRQAARFIVERAEGRDGRPAGGRHRLLDRRARQRLIREKPLAIERLTSRTVALPFDAIDGSATNHPLMPRSTFHDPETSP